MLDIKFIRQNKELMKKVIRDKGIDLDIEFLLDLDKQRKNLLQESEQMRHEQKKFEKKDLNKAREIKKQLQILKKKLRKVEEDYKKLMLLVPNIYSEDTPIGLDETKNKEIRCWGGIPKFDFPIKTHIQLGKDLDLIDFERGAKTSGFRGYYLKNEGVLLQMGLIWDAILKLKEKKFTLMIPPTILREFALIGSGHFPFGKEDIYQIANPGKLSDGKEIKEPLYLAGTSEPSLLAYYADTILDEKDLPIKLAGLSPCYRSEVGSYGKDTKGLFRLHEFWKAEQVIICKNDVEESNKYLEEILLIAEEILQDLKLPYKVVQICSGEMGAGKFKMYDIETWMPSRNAYCETHSASNLTTWQTRRLNIKYKTRSGKKEYAHALNNTAIASPRILISLLECYQQKDGSIIIPEVLRPYLGNKKCITKNEHNR